MDHKTKCHVADVITDAIADAGIRPRTWPYRMTASVLGPLFERDVPVHGFSRNEAKAMGVVLFLLLPVLLVGLLLAAPLEWLRSRRVTRHNAEMSKRLLSSVLPIEHDARQDTPVAVDFRIEHNGREVFFGVALVAVLVDGPELMGWCVHRGRPPKRVLDAAALRDRLTARGALAPLVSHWQWSWRDPYELVERPARPW